MMFLVLTGEKYLVVADSIEEAENKIASIDFTQPTTSDVIIPNEVQYLETDTWTERIA